MFDVIILVAGILVVVAAISSGSVNPFVILKEVTTYIGFGVGYAPKATERAIAEAKVLKAEADLEIAKSGREAEVGYRIGRKAGSKLSHEHHSAATEVANTKRAELIAQLESRRRS